MNEAVEQLVELQNTSQAVQVRFSYSRPEQRWINRTMIRVIEALSGQPRLERLSFR